MWVRWKKHDTDSVKAEKRSRSYRWRAVQGLVPLETTGCSRHDPTQGILWESMLQQPDFNYKVIPRKVFTVGPSQSTHHLEPHCCHQLNH